MCVCYSNELTAQTLSPRQHWRQVLLLKSKYINALRAVALVCYSLFKRVCVCVWTCEQLKHQATTAASNNICKYFTATRHTLDIHVASARRPRLKFAFLFNCGNCGIALPTHTPTFIHIQILRVCVSKEILRQSDSHWGQIFLYNFFHKAAKHCNIFLWPHIFVLLYIFYLSLSFHLSVSVCPSPSLSRFTWRFAKNILGIQKQKQIWVLIPYNVCTYLYLYMWACVSVWVIRVNWVKCVVCSPCVLRLTNQTN